MVLVLALVKNNNSEWPYNIHFYAKYYKNI